MPRKMDPSFEVKKIIWDVAATNGLVNYSAIWREVDYQLKKLRKRGDFFEETPDSRKMKDIILNDIQKLSPEIVIEKLPRHVWVLYNNRQRLMELDAILNHHDSPYATEKKINNDQPVTQAAQVVPESNLKLNDVEFKNKVLQIAQNKVGVIFYNDFFDLNPKPGTYHFLFKVKNILISSGYTCHERDKKFTWGCDYKKYKTHFHHPTLGIVEEKIINRLVLPDVGEKQLKRDQPANPVVTSVKTKLSDSSGDDDFTNKVLQIAQNKKGVIFFSDFVDLNPKPGTSLYLFRVKNILLYHDYICHERKRKTTWDCKYTGKLTHFHHPRKAGTVGYSEDEVHD